MAEGQLVVPGMELRTYKGRLIKITGCWWHLELSEFLHIYLAEFKDRLRVHIRLFKVGENGSTIHTTSDGMMLDASQAKELLECAYEAAKFVVGEHELSKVSVMFFYLFIFYPGGRGGKRIIYSVLLTVITLTDHGFVLTEVM